MAGGVGRVLALACRRLSSAQPPTARTATTNDRIRANACVADIGRDAAALLPADARVTGSFVGETFAGIHAARNSANNGRRPRRFSRAMAGGRKVVSDVPISEGSIRPGRAV